MAIEGLRTIPQHSDLHISDEVASSLRVLEAVANVSPARLCGNGLRETPEQ
jgi:hypothetical protein